MFAAEEARGRIHQGSQFSGRSASLRRLRADGLGRAQKTVNDSLKLLRDLRLDQFENGALCLLSLLSA